MFFPAFLGELNLKKHHRSAVLITNRFCQGLLNGACYMCFYQINAIEKNRGRTGNGSLHLHGDTGSKPACITEATLTQFSSGGIHVNMMLLLTYL